MLKLARRARGHFVTLIEILVHLIMVKPGHRSPDYDLFCCKARRKRIDHENSVGGKHETYSNVFPTS